MRSLSRSLTISLRSFVYTMASHRHNNARALAEALPEFPYRPGRSVLLREHVPPPPTAYNYVYWDIDRTEGTELLREREELSLQQRYHKHPPIETKPLGSALSLRILTLLRAGPSYPAQLVRAQADNIANGKPIVAKFYDPFYWDHEQDDIEPFRFVDFEYSHEAAAYRQLDKLQGSLIPKYYGSYSCEVPLGDRSPQARSVRVNLIEFVQGICLESLSLDVVKSLPQSTKQNIMEKIVRADSYAFAYGVKHRDVWPRNVIVQSPNLSGFDDPKVRVVLLDFGTAKIKEMVNKITDAAVSPILRWHANNMRHEQWQDRGWVDWEWQPWIERCFADDPVFEPITEELSDFWVRYLPSPPRSPDIRNEPST